MEPGKKPGVFQHGAFLRGIYGGDSGTVCNGPGFGAVCSLLRRPFSIHRPVVRDGVTVGIELLYKVVGNGTRLLSTVAAGAVLDILGPIGNGFTIPKAPRTVYLVGGGIGVPPLVFLASELVESGMDMASSIMFLGGRSKEDLLCIDDFEDMGIEVRTTTDDGSAGDQCLVTHPLELAVAATPPDMIYACGPLPMLSCIAGISEKYRIECQISIESMMACGLGACLGCAVEKREDSGSYWHVCKDGPVFNASQLRL